MVASSCAVSEHEVRVTQVCPRCGSDRHGRPTVTLPDRRPGPAVSWAYADGVVCVAIAHAASVGVDLEAWPPAHSTPRLAAALASVATPPEAGAEPAHLLALWTRTEAVAKAWGTGLPSASRVRFADGTATVAGDSRCRGWSVTDLAVDGPHRPLRGALAVEVSPEIGPTPRAEAGAEGAPTTQRTSTAGRGR